MPSATPDAGARHPRTKAGHRLLGILWIVLAIRVRRGRSVRLLRCARRVGGLVLVVQVIARIVRLVTQNTEDRGNPTIPTNPNRRMGIIMYYRRI